ncbi:MAG: homoserine dehydrogenase [Actinobacteria bacterium]|nr:homoserine dehydrogenase [Actinomycetota bacterium]
MTARTIRVGILGNGNIGEALVDRIEAQRGDLAARTGIDLEIAKVAVRTMDELRSTHLAADVVTTDAMSICVDEGIDVVVELIGGVEPARTFVLAALGAHKPVVTANKALIAATGTELFDVAVSTGVDFLFEAAVGGGIPIIRPLRESLIGDRITRVLGIVNGTTNYVLTRMTEEGSQFGDVLAEAQRLGFAEANPAADIGGHDAAAKAAILATIAFGTTVVADQVYTEGIDDVDAELIDRATRLGYVIKLLAIVERVDDGADTQTAVRVHPTMVPLDHPLAAVRDSFNAVFVQGEAVDDLMFYGRGAGGGPTATAVLGDVIDAARNLVNGTHADVGRLVPAEIRPIGELTSAYYLDPEVVDRPGVLRAVAEVLARHDVSIRSLEQIDAGGGARLIFITHIAREADIQAVRRELADLDVVVDVGRLVRVIADA